MDDVVALCFFSDHLVFVAFYELSSCLPHYLCVFVVRMNESSLILDLYSFSKEIRGQLVTLLSVQNEKDQAPQCLLRGVFCF